MSYLEQRAVKIQHLATRINLQYTAQDDWGLIGLLEDFRLFKSGRRKQIVNVLSAQDEWAETQFYIFDYHYKPSRKSIKRQTVCFVKSKQLALPEFLLRPESVMDKIKGLLGFEDIDFEAHPQFSTQYHLTGDDEEWIRDTFDENVIRFFTVEKNWSLEGVGYFMIFYRNNWLLSPKSVIDFYKKSKAIAHLMQLKPL